MQTEMIDEIWWNGWRMRDTVSGNVGTVKGIVSGSDEPGMRRMVWIVFDGETMKDQIMTSQLRHVKEKKDGIAD